MPTAPDYRVYIDLLNFQIDGLSCNFSYFHLQYKLDNRKLNHCDCKVTTLRLTGDSIYSSLTDAPSTLAKTNQHIIIISQ